MIIENLKESSKSPNDTTSNPNLSPIQFSNREIPKETQNISELLEKYFALTPKLTGKLFDLSNQFSPDLSIIDSFDEPLFWHPVVRKEKKKKNFNLENDESWVPIVIVKNRDAGQSNPSDESLTKIKSKNLHSTNNNHLKKKIVGNSIVKHLVKSNKKYFCPTCGSNQTSQWRIISGKVHCNACYAKLRRWIIKFQKNIQNVADTQQGFKSLGMKFEFDLRNQT